MYEKLKTEFFIKCEVYSKKQKRLWIFKLYENLFLRFQLTTIKSYPGEMEILKESEFPPYQGCGAVVIKLLTFKSFTMNLKI